MSTVVTLASPDADQPGVAERLLESLRSPLSERFILERSAPSEAYWAQESIRDKSRVPVGRVRIPPHGSLAPRALSEYAEYADRHLPPRFVTIAINMMFSWDPSSFSNGEWFYNEAHREAYCELLRASQRNDRVIRILDGAYVRDWKSERDTRFVYYRKPIDFAAQFLELRGLVGDPPSVVAELERLARDDALTKAVHERHPVLAKFEKEGGLFKPFRHLRLSAAGGLVLETYRCWVGRFHAMEDGADDRAILTDLLISRGVVRPAGAKRDSAPE